MYKPLIILLVEAAGTSETLVTFYQTAQHHNPEDSHICVTCDTFVSCALFRLPEFDLLIESSTSSGAFSY
jgi:hypothetical protein